ncbi:hypothetical protein GCM10009811_18270 [Nostocoides veronense]|uniref:Thymidylate synthase/dCMP hydroxymethylase domain-containing protein n=2 Tax=Nostocoides veronense TaxID=330836 RepID=A0ABP4XT06_9MICO
MRYRNINQAVPELLRLVLDQGRTVTPRGDTTLEVGPIQFTLERPQERCLVLNHRNNNVFAAIVESMWVISGRNDTATILPYLPRANDFSDDGETWRGGYGPRLRNWSGHDQIDAVRSILTGNPDSRRAVAVIFDPAQDHVESRDIPCNNWLHFIQRDGKLNVHVAVRSNDIIWGLSGINAFEWGFLLELMAHWLDLEVGTLTFSTTSAHIYERHWDRAKEIAQAPRHDIDPYAGSHSVQTVAFGTAWEDLDAVLDEWWNLEKQIRTGEVERARLDAFPDPLLRSYLCMLRVFWAAKRDPQQDLSDLLAPLAGTDLGLATVEYLRRSVRTDYLAAIVASDSDPKASGDGPAGDYHDHLRAALKRLHASKTAVYGDSWKRRGEVLGVMANIARKVDRLNIISQEMGKARGTADENILDTAIDLYIYVVKYATFLADAGEFHPAVDITASTWSDGTEGFDAVLDSLAEGGGAILDERSSNALVQASFARLEAATLTPSSDVDKVQAMLGLIQDARAVIDSITQRSSAAVDAQGY